jgi:pimeloyl-ACP methyl ester carboxylesterase
MAGKTLLQGKLLEVTYPEREIPLTREKRPAYTSWAYVVDHGSGPAVVILSGPATASFDWQDVVYKLADSHRVIVIDRPGSGFARRAPEGGPSYLYDEADVVRQVMERQGVDSATLVGHGMGCLVAEAFARITPDLVEKLVLVEPRVEVAGEPREKRVERMRAQNVPLPGLLETFLRIQREWLMSSKLWAKFLVFVQNRAKKTPLRTLNPAEERALMNTIYNRDYILRGILREYDSEQKWLMEIKKLQADSPLVAPTTVIGAEPKKEIWGTGWIDALDHYVQKLEADAPANLVRIKGQHMLMRDKPGKLAKAITGSQN